MSDCRRCPCECGAADFVPRNPVVDQVEDHALVCRDIGEPRQEYTIGHAGMGEDQRASERQLYRARRPPVMDQAGTMPRR